jgi:hypothetical protein
MYSRKTKFVPFLVVLAIVLCGTWALAANGVFDTSQTNPEIISEAETGTAGEGYISSANHTSALELQRAMTQLESAATELNAITEASSGTSVYYWMCYGETVGASLDTMNALFGRYNEICQPPSQS